MKKEPLHIIVEGCDATGKTTLINELHNKLGYAVVKGSDFQIAEQGVDKMFEYMMNIATLDENLIIDRDFISNLVYAPLYDKNMLRYEMIDELINIKKDKSILIYLYAYVDDIKTRLSNRGDDYVSVDKIETILDSYVNISKIYPINSKLNIYSFNTSVYNSSEIVEWLMDNVIRNEMNYYE